MHKGFYASGFLYHPPTTQILLHTSLTDPQKRWSLFGGVGAELETAEMIFQRVIFETFSLKLPIKHVFPVYTYYNDDKHRECTVHYAHTALLKSFPQKKDRAFSWFTVRQINKLPLSVQTKHDITIALRVIGSNERKRLGQYTME